MKYLVVFYSRNGTTKKIAHTISENLKCDMEEIVDTKKRAGTLGYISAGKDATFKRLTKIKETQKNPKDYDAVIIGTPVWAFTMSPAIRTYLTKNKKDLKKVAFFCTMGGSGSTRTFSSMEKLCNNKPITTLELTTKEVIDNNFIGNVKKFINEITSI